MLPIKASQPICIEPPTITQMLLSLLPSHNRLLKFTTQSLSHLSAPKPLHTPWIPIIRGASHAGDLGLGKRAHALVITSGAAAADRFLANNLITMYSKCGSVAGARRLFDQTPHRDSVTWNSLLSAYALHAQAVDALLLFRLMLRSAVPPTHLTFTPILKLCSSSPDLLPTSQAIHCYSMRIGLDCDALVSSALVNVYSKFGLLEGARYLFDGMPERDTVLWNIMIKGYAQTGLVKDAFFMFSELHRSETLRPDDISVRCVLTGSESGMMFDQVQSFGLKLSLFDNCSDVITWNKTMSEHVKAGDKHAVLECFLEMKRLSVGHDNVTFVIVLSAITGAECFVVGKQIHGVAIKTGFCLDVSVANNLINMYAKMGSLDYAWKVFDAIEVLDLVSWNSIISASVQNGLEEESVALFTDMSKHGVAPDQFTLATVLRASSGIVRCSSVHEQIHNCAIKMGLSVDNFVITALIDVYAKKGSMDEAHSLFSGMNWFDLASCNALLAGYITNNDSYKTLELFRSIQRTDEKPNHFTLATVLKACSGLVAFEQGKEIHAHVIKLGFDSDLCVSSGIVDMYIKCGNLMDASATFEDICEPDEVAWTAMISGCVENGDEDYALSLYRKMRRLGAFPDEFTLASLIKACSCLAALEQGRQIHANAIKLECASDAFVGTSIMDMYAKCGSIEDSYQLFKSLGEKSTASWNAMLLGFAQHGHGKEAMHLFERMRSRRIQPDKITFIGVLSACSHSGLVSTAHSYFDSMLKDYGIEPEIEHYSCLVDVLGRAGLLSEAEKVIETMPFSASASMCRALLGACRIQKNMKIGQRVATRLLDLDPDDSSAYVLLSNMYATANHWDDVADARKRMQSRRVCKDPGYSWIEVKNKVHLFIVDDRSHPESAAIYDELEDLIRRIKDEGYVPDTDVMLLDVEEEEKERALYYHSEKLAIAYGLISTPSPLRIRVIKNLRVCVDCHNAIKYISQVVRREIVLRDASRFHCFRDGSCSCGDYW